jgi:hypothetical protein
LQNYPTFPRDPATGYSLDIGFLQANGNPCYVLPWGSSTDCVTNPIIDLFPNAAPAASAAFMSAQRGIPTPPAYANNFYPMNFSVATGTMAPWITPANFLAASQNVADHNHAISTDASGRKQRFKFMTFPMMTAVAGANPYIPGNWASGAQIVAAMESYAGMNLAGQPACNDDGPSCGLTLANRATTYIDLLIKYFKNVSTGNLAPGINSGNYIFGDLNYIGSQPGLPSQRSIAYLFDWGTGGKACDDNTGAPATCTYQASSPTTLVAPANLDQRYVNSGDFQLRLDFGERGLFPYFGLNTRYWDATKLRTRNRIGIVEGNLFANQFIAYADDSFSDRQIQFHGCLVAKEVLGRFSNNWGSDRTYSPGYLQSSTQSFGFTAYSPSIVLYQDPRYQFNAELIYREYGSELLHY